MVNGYILDKQRGQSSHHLHGCNSSILIWTLDAFGQDNCNLIFAMSVHEYVGVMIKYSCNTPFDLEGSGGLDEVKHPHDERVD